VDHGTDLIGDFERDLELIDLTALGLTDFAALTISTGVNGDALVDTGVGTILLVGIDMDAVAAGDFLL